MKVGLQYFLVLSAIAFCQGCSQSEKASPAQVHRDVAFVQDYSEKFLLQDSADLRRVASDRNGVIQISSAQDLLQPHAAQFLFPGTLVQERYYRPIADKNIRNVITYREHLVYVDDKAVLSNAWA